LKKKFSVTNADGFQYLSCRPSSPAERVEIFFTTRVGGRSLPPYDQCNLGSRTEDEEAAVEINREMVLASLGISGVFLPRQVHGSVSLSSQAESRGFVFGGEGDAAVSGSPGQAVGVLTADCLPVMIYSPTSRSVAAVHVGWRGVVRGVIPSALEALGDPGRGGWAACLGPAIGPCCFEVGREVADEVTRASTGTAVKEGPSKPRLDLAAAALHQLVRGGVDPGTVTSAEMCTSCNPELFFSHRRDGGKTGRMAGIIIRRRGEG
jgi:YfiH family protein